MKKTNLLLPVFLLLSAITHAQINWNDYNITTGGNAIKDNSAIAVLQVIQKDNTWFDVGPARTHYLQLYANDFDFMQLVHSENRYFDGSAVYDTSKVYLFIFGVNEGDTDDYEYRINGIDDKLIIPWSDVHQFADTAFMHQFHMERIACLGGFSPAIGGLLITEVRRKSTGKIIATSLLERPAVHPFITNIFTSDDLNDFLNSKDSPFMLSAGDKFKSTYKPDELTLTGVPKHLKVKVGNTNLIFNLDVPVHARKQVEYELIRDGKVYKPWQQNDFDGPFIWLKDFPAGDYVLKFRYTAQRENVSEYPFTVAKPWYQAVLFTVLFVLLGAVIIGGSVFLLLLSRQRRKTKEALAKQEKLQLELRSIHAQFNPHFVFNALSSIQGLINNHDIKAANDYLSEFARLMQKALHNSTKESIPLHEELQTLETYLKLEQLRFGFTYQLNVDENIDSYITSIPNLLLQPLIENAVKHGVSSLQEKGMIFIHISRRNDAMIADIRDNGPGFVSQNVNNGFGLKLTRERMQLLNELNKEQPITMQTNSTAGAEVTITFNHWFS